MCVKRFIPQNHVDRQYLVSWNIGKKWGMLVKHIMSTLGTASTEAIKIKMTFHVWCSLAVDQLSCGYCRMKLALLVCVGTSIQKRYTTYYVILGVILLITYYILFTKQRFTQFNLDKNTYCFYDNLHM